jgi:hypothetical protein
MNETALQSGYLTAAAVNSELANPNIPAQFSSGTLYLKT